MSPVALDSQASLPIISIAPFLTDSDIDRSSPDLCQTDARRNTARALHEACLSHGFFYLNLEGFLDESFSEPKRLENLARDFFKSDQAAKDEIGILKGDAVRGYQRVGENVTLGKPDGHEALDTYAPAPKLGVGLPPQGDTPPPLMGENQWPSEKLVPGFQRSFESWTERMKVLGMAVMEGMAAGLGLTYDEWLQLRGQVDDSFWVMRIIGYPPLPVGQKAEQGVSCGEHKDYGCLTFLYTDETKSALQVLSTSGEWLDADPIPGCFVVNIGEMWEVWTNGLYQSTLHRVIHRGTNYRVSIPFFFEPNFDAVVSPLPAAMKLRQPDSRPLPSDQRAKQQKSYTPVRYGDFLLSKVTTNFAPDGTKKGKYD